MLRSSDRNLRLSGIMAEHLSIIGYHEYNGYENSIAPNQTEPYLIIIFDNIVCCNQGRMKKYFCFGRHKEYRLLGGINMYISYLIENDLHFS